MHRKGSNTTFSIPHVGSRDLFLCWWQQYAPTGWNEYAQPMEWNTRSAGTSTYICIQIICSIWNMQVCFSTKPTTYSFICNIQARTHVKPSPKPYTPLPTRNMTIIYRALQPAFRLATAICLRRKFYFPSTCWSLQNLIIGVNSRSSCTVV